MFEFHAWATIRVEDNSDPFLSPYIPTVEKPWSEIRE
jgi:hypothetical protein